MSWHAQIEILTGLKLTAFYCSLFCQAVILNIFGPFSDVNLFRCFYCKPGSMDNMLEIFLFVCLFFYYLTAMIFYMHH